jgi:hypothetical protein
MNGGTIFGNSAEIGGGVCVGSGTFIMKGGIIEANRSVSTTVVPKGGGVYITSGSTAEFLGGTIDANSAEGSNAEGGGVYSEDTIQIPAGIFGSYNTLEGTNPVTGTENYNYQFTRIYTLQDLESIASTAANPHKIYLLMADIDASGSPWPPIGDNTAPFKGGFWGNGKTITLGAVGVSSGASTTQSGLFGQIGSQGIVKNLTIAGTITPTGPTTGAIAGTIEAGGTVADCAVTASIVFGPSGGVTLGGIAGISAGTIKGCSVTGTVENTGQGSAVWTVGGIVGSISTGGSVINCYTTGAVLSTGESIYIGGIAGQTYGSIANCYTTAPVTSDCEATGTREYSGGIVGYVNGTGSVKHCYTRGIVIRSNSSAVTYERCIGGIAGFDNGTIEYCHTEGTISVPTSTSVDTIGGIAGTVNTATTLSHCVALTGNLSDSISTNVHRVAGDNSGTLTSNFGKDSMQKNGAANTWSNDPANVDGGDVAMTDAVSFSWWTGTAGWSAVFDGHSDTAPWVWENDRPILYWERE